MMPGLCSPPLISPRIAGPAVRRKLTDKQTSTASTSIPRGDVFIGIMSRNAASPPQGGGRIFEELSSGTKLAHIGGGQAASGSTGYSWQTRSSWIEDWVLALGGKLPEGVTRPSAFNSNLRWSADRQSAGSLTIPTSSMVRTNSIAVAAVSSGIGRQVSINSWNTGGSGESFDIDASRSGDYGTCSIIRMMLFVDGPPAFDITVGFGSSYNSQYNCMCAIWEWVQ